MAEQTERFKGLRRICQAQEGLLSPSYQVHDLFFLNMFPGIDSEFVIETEATDLWIPYYRQDFEESPASPAPRFPLAQFGFFLNDSKSDIITIDQYHVPEKITNFPFYKITFRLLDSMAPFEHMHFKFYTFTDPRVIQALGKL